MKREILICMMISLILLLVGGVQVFAGQSFNMDNLDKGVIGISCDGGGKIKVIIQKGDKKYTYDINSEGRQEEFPLQLGNGSYKVSVFANTSGNAYRLLSSKDISVKLENSNEVFLTSIQNINWNVDSKAVAKAVELTKDIKDPKQKATKLWDYMVKNNSYDFEKLSTVLPGYIPIIDRTLEEKKGICYDFSSLYAAMLRSQGQPAKLVKGYAPKNASGYHAWNEVYDKEKGEWLVIDTTYDLQVIGRNPKVEMIKKTENFNKVYEY